MRKHKVGGNLKKDFRQKIVKVLIQIKILFAVMINESYEMLKNLRLIQSF